MRGVLTTTPTLISHQHARARRRASRFGRFVLFLMVAAITILNLIVAVVCQAFDEVKSSGDDNYRYQVRFR